MLCLIIINFHRSLDDILPKLDKMYKHLLRMPESIYLLEIYIYMLIKKNNEQNFENIFEIYKTPKLYNFIIEKIKDNSAES